jgi:hypothetical protein
LNSFPTLKFPRVNARGPIEAEHRLLLVGLPHPFPRVNARGPIEYRPKNPPIKIGVALGDLMAGF